MPGTKKCPYCGEEIKEGAIKCKHCQSMLVETETAPPVQASASKIKNPIYKRWWFWVATIIVIIIGIGSCNGGNDSTEPGTGSSSSSVEAPVEEVNEPVVVTVDELIDALRKNALSAADTYKDEYVELTGRLTNIDSDGKYFSLGMLSDEWSFDSVSCRIKKEHLDTVMTFENKQEVTVVGTITSVGEVLGYTLEVESIL